MYPAGRTNLDASIGAGVRVFAMSALVTLALETALAPYRALFIKHFRPLACVFRSGLTQGVIVHDILRASLMVRFHAILPIDGSWSAENNYAAFMHRTAQNEQRASNTYDKNG